MTLELGAIGNDELLELIQQEGRQAPTTISQPELITYLLELNKEQRKKQSSNWRKLEQQARSTAQTEKPGIISVDVWRSRISLVLMKSFFLLDIGVLLLPVFGLLTVLLPIGGPGGLKERLVCRPTLASFQK